MGTVVEVVWLLTGVWETKVVSQGMLVHVVVTGTEVVTETEEEVAEAELELEPELGVVEVAEAELPVEPVAVPWAAQRAWTAGRTLPVGILLVVWFIVLSSGLARRKGEGKAYRRQRQHRKPQ